LTIYYFRLKRDRRFFKMSIGRENCVFFSAPIKGERDKIECIIIKLGEWIKTKGFRIVNDHVVSENPRPVLAAKLGKLSKDLTLEEIENYNVCRILEAKYLIAEVSGASTGVGREIEYARNFGYNMKILCLYQKDYKHTASPMILGMDKNRYPNVTVACYQDIQEAKYIIKDFLGMQI
jgi:hypothetical protein